MSFQSEIRDALEKGDVQEVARLFYAAHPHLPTPSDKQEHEVVMHQARTSAESVSLAKRLYSHAWLSDRGYKSGLPEEMRPPVEQKVSRIVAAVGVSYNTQSSRPDRIEEAKHIERIMSQVGGDMIESGITDSKKISAAMWAARDAYINNQYKKMV